jgi:hypothetical protein
VAWHIYVTEDCAVPAPQIGLGEPAVRHRLAADEDLVHDGMMAIITDSYLEIDVRTDFRAQFGPRVDLGVWPGIDGRTEPVDRA